MPSAEIVKIDPVSAGGFFAMSITASATFAGDCRGPIFSRNFSAQHRDILRSHLLRRAQDLSPA